jgi:hypothetical protein
VKLAIIAPMSACAAQTFTGITQSHFDALARKVSAAGVRVDGPTGTGSRNGFTVVWIYDAAGQTLVIQCTDSPFSVTCGSINQRIHDLVDSAAAQ